METLKYKVITSRRQYDKYCKTLEDIVFSSPKTKGIKEEVALLTLLIEKYDEKNTIVKMTDPITLLRSLMSDHKIKAVDLAGILGVSEGLVSDILRYRKGLSKETIRILSERFKLNQEAFNRPYELRSQAQPAFRNRKKVGPKKKLVRV